MPHTGIRSTTRITVQQANKQLNRLAAISHYYYIYAGGDHGRKSNSELKYPLGGGQRLTYSAEKEHLKSIVHLTYKHNTGHISAALNVCPFLSSALHRLDSISGGGRQRGIIISMNGKRR